MAIENDKYELDAVVQTEAQKKVMRRRNLAIALVLGALAVIFFASTIIRLGANVADRTF
ncbi:MAG: CoxF protein [Hyphomicrobiales bacterium]